MMPAVRIALLSLTLVALTGCVRSQLPDTEDIDCGPGTRIVDQNAAFCVYLEDAPEECPLRLPYPHRIQGVPICSGDNETPLALLESAVVQAVETVGFGEAGPRPAPQPIEDGGPRDGTIPIDAAMRTTATDIDAR
jgi:hypothetical protein